MLVPKAAEGGGWGSSSHRRTVDHQTQAAATTRWKSKLRTSRVFRNNWVLTITLHRELNFVHHSPCRLEVNQSGQHLVICLIFASPTQNGPERTQNFELAPGVAMQKTKLNTPPLLEL